LQTCLKVNSLHFVSKVVFATVGISHDSSR
jgi:hypothetical protein